jgi:hypothetical protein
MTHKVIFKINEELDFRNHLIGARRISGSVKNIPPEVVRYYELLRDTDEDKKLSIFKEESFGFYKDEMKDIRSLFVKQTEEMWSLIEDKYFSKMENIFKREFPFEKITGVLSTAIKFYGYDFNKNNPWFACPIDSPVKSIHVAMHEIMHSYFHVYFLQECKSKFELNDEQIWTVKEALTTLLNLELGDMRIYTDKGKPGHEKLRAKIEEDWLKYKDIKKVLEEACVFVKIM